MRHFPGRTSIALPNRRDTIRAAALVVATLGLTPNGRADRLGITTMLPFDYGVTGIRADAGNEVVITGGTGLPNLIQPTPAFIYAGPLDGALTATTTGDSRLHLFTPTFSGTAVYSSMFYGPNTHRFNPSTIAAGNIRAVGAYLQNGPADFQKGMIYDGPLDGSGTWTSLQVPGADVGVTIPHSTMGNLVVGNYNLLTSLSVGQPFVYDIGTQSYNRLDINGAYEATIYGIWQNGGETSSSYTIVGGLSQTSSSKGQGFIASYDSSSMTMSGLTLYSFNDDVNIDTHFEGISAFAGGFSIAANSIVGVTAGAYAFIPYTGTVGTYAYGAATWKGITNTVNGTATTGDTVIDDKVMGIYAVPGGIRSYVTTTIPEIDPAGFGSMLALLTGALGLKERRRTGRSAGPRYHGQTTGR